MGVRDVELEVTMGKILSVLVDCHLSDLEAL